MSLTVLFAAASVAVNAANITVTSFNDHQSAATALRVRPGDTITLPALESGSYAVGNARFASISGDVVTAVEPGILAVYQIGSDGVAIDAVLPVFILPEPTAGGRVFICDVDHWSLGNGGSGWCNGDGGWINAADSSTGDHPRLPGDIAMIGRLSNGWGMDIEISSPISVGAIYYGNFKDYDSFNGDPNYCFRLKSSQSVALTLSTGTKKNALVQFCPNLRTAERKLMFAFSTGLTVTSTRDVDIDFGWDESANDLNLVYFRQYADSTLNIPEGKTFKFINSSPHENGYMHRDIELLGIISGAGTLQNSSRENMLCDFSNATAFTGTIRESGYKHAGFDRDATTWFLNCTTLQNAALEVSGYVVRTDYKTYSVNDAAGYARIGSNHTWPGQSEVGNRLPQRALILNGGHVDLLGERTAWSEGAVNTYSTRLLAVSNGFSVIAVDMDMDQYNSAYPDTLFTAEACTHDKNATVAIRDSRIWRTSGCEHVEVRFPWFSEYSSVTGGIIPWMVAWIDHPEYSSWENLRFPGVDEDGNLRELSDTAYAAGKNAVVDRADLTLDADMAVNSLAVFNTYGGNCDVGEGRTLTISSGGLILISANKIGQNPWHSSSLSPTAGTIAFGATAYVFSNNATMDGETKDLSWIWTPMIAPYGFVSAFPGYLTICGDQTGIDDEIVVQAGGLTLGLAKNNNGVDLVVPCQIDVPVRIVGGGSTLKLAANSHLASDQNVYFDDIGGFAGKLDIPAGTTETCMKCYVDGVTISRGTWGATGSGADNIDDEHFSGLGVLKVRKDELNRAMKIVVR
jgi:hypothetical protein